MDTGTRKLVNTKIDGLLWRMARVAALRDGVTLQAFVARALLAEILATSVRLGPGDEYRTQESQSGT